MARKINAVSPNESRLNEFFADPERRNTSNFRGISYEDERRADANEIYESGTKWVNEQLETVGGSGGGAQPDWNAAEGEPGHILNRPFYSEVVESVDVEVKEQTITSVTNSSGKHNAKLYNKDTGLVATKDNTHVIVVFDGELFDLRSNNNLLGNRAILGVAGAVDTGEPFYIGTGNNVTNIYTKTPGDHTIAITVYKEETVYHTIDPKFLPGGGSGGGGGDLLDENGIIKQEYFPKGFPYKSGEDNAVILPSTTLELNPDMGAFIIPDALEFVAGQKYVVKFENLGYEFTTVCQEAPENSDGLKWILGDSGLLGDASITDEPFVMLVVDPALAPDVGFGAMLMFAGDSTTLTVSVAGFVGKFSKIDNEYIEQEPETVVAELIGSNTSGYTSSHSVDEIIELVNSGKDVVIRHGDNINSNKRSVFRVISCNDASATFACVEIFVDRVSFHTFPLTSGTVFQMITTTISATST